MSSLLQSSYVAASIPVFLLLLLLIRFIIYPAFWSTLSKIPNAHFSAPFLGVWIGSKRRHGTGIREILAAHRKHGPIVRLSPDELSVASLDGLRKIYLGGFEKTQWYVDEFENLGKLNMVSMVGNKPHAERKRMLSHVYSKSYLQNSEDLQLLGRVLLNERLLPILDSAARDGSPLDVYSLNQALGLDFMSAYLFGIDNSTDFVRDIAAREVYLGNWRTKSKGLPGNERATQEIESVVLSLCDATQILRHKSPSPATEPPDQSIQPAVYSQLSSHLSKSASETTPPKGRRQAIASELLDHLGAAHEATRSTLTYIQWHLSQSHDLQTKLRSELKAVEWSSLSGIPGILSIPYSLRSSASSSLASLSLLPAVITETMRVYPPAPSILPRVVPLAGASIDGFFIPGGTKVGCSALCLHRNESVYEDAESWNLWRWIPRNDEDEEEFEKLKEMRRWFWGFGSGGRMCIGKHFAIWMLAEITAFIYANFETDIVDDEGIEQDDAFLAGPKGEKLILRLRAVSSI